MVLSREDGVPPELWNALGRNIAPGQAVLLSDTEVQVPLERFLASRHWLAGSLTRYGCEVSFSTDALELLGRSDAERIEVDAALADSLHPEQPKTILDELASTNFSRRLRPFQARDLAHLLALSHGANFSVPGAGKTAVTYACHAVELHRARVARMLVVAPLSAFDSWFEEASRCFAVEPRIGTLNDRIPRDLDVLLVNYQRLASRFRTIAEWVSETPGQVVLDEAHRMKRGRGGEWGSACLDLAHLAARRDVLTGTPAPQHPSDFVALLEFLWPQQSSRIMPSSSLQPNPQPEAMAQLSGRLRPLFVRTTKNELALDDPDLRVEIVQMSPLQEQIYEALRTRMRREASISGAERIALGRVGEISIYMVQAATNPGLLAPAIGGGDVAPVVWPPLELRGGSGIQELITNYSRHEVPRKFEKLVAIVDRNAGLGRKTLVWSNFVGNLTELHERVLAPYHPALIYGAVPSGDVDDDRLTRESELRKFRTDDRCQVLLANPAAMSEGVSLHEVCHDAVYLDRTFNAGQYLQSVDRIHRLGLPPGTETRITFLLTEGTLDEAVDERVAVKARRLAQLLSDPDLVTMALPDEESYGEWIDDDDVAVLLRHLRAE